MDKREQMIRLWFSMWLEKKDLGMDDIFAENVSYTESWGPCYSNRETVKHWFQEWNTTRKRNRLGHQTVFSQRESNSGGVVF